MRNINQRFMTFKENVDIAQAKGEHKFYFKFTKKYIDNKNILDIGSWTGPFEALIYDRAKNITAVDVEKKALDVLKKNMPRVNCVVAFSHKLPFKDNTFDVVTFFDVIEHIPSGYEYVSIMEIKRVLKKNGYLFLATPHSNLLSKLFDPAYFLAGHRHYSDNSLIGFLKDLDFRVEKVVHVGSFFSSFYALTFYFFKHILRTKLPHINWLEKNMEKDISSNGYVQVVIRARKL